MENDNDNDNLYRNLVILLKIFKNRPNHLAKYLIDNSAFTSEFIENLINSEKLNKMNPNETQSYFSEPLNLDAPYFSNYEQMNDYYNDMMIQETKQLQDPSKIEEELNEKLSEHLNNENYEDAVKLRDYMGRNMIEVKIEKKGGRFIFRRN
ncbi:MAG: hypothetical protein SLAVMIC_00935 [uncultured marine phage]|uniref:Uncharacterized protein n=1 Tax=uncultured marine phage TaxID=707152 RepID=A0A8D9C9S0_9VIRU|nr:MAG: hypothetical protein SLAVMIC_00935 [uncultured marine phage]